MKNWWTDLFIKNLNTFNVGNKYNFSQEVLWAEEAEILIHNTDKLKDQIHFAVWDNSIVSLSDEITAFQSSIEKSLQKKTQFSLPYSFIEPLEKFDITKKVSDAPTVGFCGCYTHHPERQNTLLHLQLDQRLNTDFIQRMVFQGHDVGWDMANKAFKENMQSNAFNVCMRGAGNFSIRFYETLSCGRVPVLVDTDCAFPFDDVLDYSEFCIIAANNEDLSNQILHKWNDESYIEMQNRAYEVFQDYFHLNIVGKKIVEYLDRNLL